ncbi:hypothetical protein HQ36_00895 [Porphyromonas gingivicanis]|uniref:Uncharacterized protein n=1 Tax=Porphyromonas gingivicanis TaxID=266762 RepID=A0A0A2G705_9PORP|nr:hypothetical protein HQ36_00895 [Porphyromonas gingivicanis]
MKQPLSPRLLPLWTKLYNIFFARIVCLEIFIFALFISSNPLVCGDFEDKRNMYFKLAQKTKTDL